MSSESPPTDDGDGNWTAGEERSPPLEPQVETVETEEDEEDEWPPDEQIVEHEPPRMDTRKWRQLYRTRKWLKKREKLIGDGYVQWYLIGDAINRPKFVKPKRKGGGVPELDHNGQTYLFPEDAKVPSADGMWTFMHRKGEADPINIRDPVRLSIPADELKEYLDLRVSSSAPGLLDGLGLDSGDLIKIVIAGVIGYAVFTQMTGGGGIV